MTPAPPLESWRTITESVLPFLEGFVLSKVSGGLRVLAAGVKLHLAGDAGDPAAARVGDVAGYEYLEVIITTGVVSAVTLWRSPDNQAPWTAVASGAFPPGPGSGTPIAITSGSAKVTIG